MIKANTADLKNAIKAVNILWKKTTTDPNNTSAKIALETKDDESIHLLSRCDLFAIDMKITNVEKIGTNGIENSTSNNISEHELVGIEDNETLEKILSKIKTDELYLELTPKKRTLKITNGENEEYSFQTASSSNAKRATTDIQHGGKLKKITEFDSDSFAWLMSTISALGKITGESVTTPSLSCVSIHSIPSNGEPIILSGSSRDDGYSEIYRTEFKSNIDFKALLTKQISESLGAFASSAQHCGITSLSTETDDNDNAKWLVFSSDSFSLSVTCNIDAFPLSYIKKFESLADNTECDYATTRAKTKMMCDKISAMSHGDDVTDITIFGGGTIEMRKRDAPTSKASNAKIRDSSGTLIRTVDENTAVKATVSTKNMKKLIDSMKDTKDIVLSIVSTSSNAHHLVVTSEIGYAKLICVLTGMIERKDDD